MAQREKWLQLKDVTITRAGKKLLDSISFCLFFGESLAITGNSGAGKTLLAQAILSKAFHTGEIQMNKSLHENILMVEQQHHFKNLSNTSDLYYQQRYNSFDAGDAKTVMEIFPAFSRQEVTALLKEMNITYLADKPLIQLSNGENKKIQLAGVLICKPAGIILDQPFTGLDAGTRKYLHSFINDLVEKNILVILITDEHEMPVAISKVLSLENGKLQWIKTRYEFMNDAALVKKNAEPHPINFPYKNSSEHGNHKFDYAVRMKNVNVQYGETKILKAINWEVKRGERWLLSGPNGAGKSTLLSMVVGDNPQAYANEVYVFDKKRGSGESIWDIKKKVGFLSQELHVYFDKSCTGFETVASGLFDTIGLFRQLSAAENDLVNYWIKNTGLEGLRQKRLFELPVGQQRKLLLVRALVKDAPLLILDEPCQGMDAATRDAMLHLINTVCVAGNKTMIFVSHYLQDVPVCINHCIQIEKGRLH